MKPAVGKLEQEYGEQIAFARYNIDERESSTMMKRFRVSAIPVFVTLDANGDQLFKHTGGLGYKELKSDIDYALKQ
jgi:thiol-disulfide isomerase/thioredoxin